MRRREYYWSLFHKSEKNQLNDLRTDQVEAIFAAIPDRQKGEWLIWKEGLRNWKPFVEFPQLLMSLRQVKEESVNPPPPSEPMTSLEHETDFDFGADTESYSQSGVELSLLHEGGGDGRHEGRYQKRLEARIVNHDKVFPNQTVNISMHGMQLQNPLPTGLPRYFNVEIKHQDLVVSLVCSEIRSSGGKPSRRLKIELNDRPSLLSAILLGA